MHYRKLGTSNFTVSVVSFGAWQIGDPAYWGSDRASNPDAAVRAAVDAGVNLFDTAESYGGGESERALGRALGRRRDAVLIATKVSPSHCAPDQLRQACEASLERLATDHIDLYQVHWPCRDVPFEASCDALARLRDQGKIRAIGVSNFGVQDLDAWMRAGTCVSNQLGYSLAFRAIEHAIVPACAKHGVGILVYMPLLQGILTGRWKTPDDIPEARRRTRHFSSARSGTRHGEPGCETALFDLLRRLDRLAGDRGLPVASLALAWVMAQPGVTSVILGSRDPAQLARNVAAADLVLDSSTIERLDGISTDLKAALGPNPDMWLSGPDARMR